MKGAVLSFTGNVAALAQIPAPDEIIKNSLANYAFENFEIAVYTSLLAIVELVTLAGGRAPSNSRSTKSNGRHSSFSTASRRSHESMRNCDPQARQRAPDPSLGKEREGLLAETISDRVI